MLPTQELGADESKSLLQPFSDVSVQNPVATVVFIHDVTGDISCYQALAVKHESAFPEIPTYGVCSPAFFEKAPAPSIQAMADSYSAVIKESLKGPIILVGYSFGGYVAREMSYRLPGSSVLLIDTAHPDLLKKVPHADYLWDAVGKIIEQFNKANALDFPSLDSLIDPDEFKKIADDQKLNKLTEVIFEYIEKNEALSSSKSIPILKTQLELLQHHLQMVQNYIPSSLDEKIKPVVVTANHSVAIYGESCLGWKDATTSTCDNVDHFSLMQQDGSLQQVLGVIKDAVKPYKTQRLLAEVKNRIEELSKLEPDHPLLLNFLSPSFSEPEPDGELTKSTEECGSSTPSPTHRSLNSVKNKNSAGQKSASTPSSPARSHGLSLAARRASVQNHHEQKVSNFTLDDQPPSESVRATAMLRYSRDSNPSTPKDPKVALDSLAAFITSTPYNPLPNLVSFCYSSWLSIFNSRQQTFSSTLPPVLKNKNS